jgi:spore coat polysaccharide biosynthesis predicted glycosyltransferase SpsG
MNAGTLLIRADANAAIGTGHIMRCLALAQGWQDAGGVVVVAAAELPVAIEQRLTAEEITIVKLRSDALTGSDAPELTGVARERKAPWVILDGERFGSDYITTLKQHNLKILWVDDFGSERAHDADLRGQRSGWLD